MKKMYLVLSALLAFGVAVSATAAEVTFHGDLNNRFLIYTNHSDFFQAEQQGSIADDEVDESFAELKYRFWLEGSTNDGNVKGVYAIEVGGINFGQTDKGGGYSGDKVNIETRWAYTDFQIPGIDSKARFKIGLMPVKVNPYLWNETATAVLFNGGAGMVDVTAGWIRTYEYSLKTDPEDDSEDVDNYYLRLNVDPTDRFNVGIFGLYQAGDPDNGGETYGAISQRNYLLKKFADKVDLGIWSVGLDGSFHQPIGAGKFFVNWDLIYQGGEINQAEFMGRQGDFDLSAYFGHVDVGVNFGKSKVTYTGWYTSGDDDPGDSDFEGFLATDLDITDSIILFEGMYSDDDVFSERHYLLDKGFIMNKLAFDFKATDKLTVGAAGLYMMTAEDIEYTDNNGVRQEENSVGIEVDAYFSYKIYKNLELAASVGYLFADDAMDFFEVDQNGSSDEDIFLSSARVRYKF